ncbi:helix-turn-helix domain-containing protein [Roseibacillus ishigakijimensis]|uniref:Helix-turn-helix domain-containing protein n=1 Tax=Roseibacillus ishigakijimensis TaxID=454146 RepID=A0A934VIG1_9BACT|nr:helix-turn-helix domain-containing protein [Roseibacillus ishigakijimensis]MBK1835038.1 helix-turn-helix domain-containing protein [Roseibacillus ishigakijimensis]
MIQLSPEHEARIIEEATRELVKALITNHGKKVWLTKNEAAGILNWSPQTVMTRLPHYDTTGNGGSIRFLLSDIEAEMEKRKVK